MNESYFMKYYFYLLLSTAIWTGCVSSKDSKTASSEEKVLRNALKMLDQDPTNNELKKTVTTLYNSESKSHLDKIAALNNSAEISKWDKIIKEYQTLHNLSEIVIGYAEGSRLLKPALYVTELQTTRERAAESYYDLGDKYLKDGDKESARKAYFSFRKSIEYQPGYKDVKLKMNTAFNNGIINVVINPVEDNMFYYGGPGFANSGNSYSNDYFQRSLVRDLGGNYSKINGALFYTDWDARRQNIQPDWIVELRWADINIPPPIVAHDTRTISSQIESGHDTAGHTLYQRIQAILYIERSNFTASGDMEVKVTDMNTRRTVADNRYSGQYSWQEESATYTGDSRALGSSYNHILNNKNYRVPTQQDILAQLYQRVYQQVKNRLYTLARW